jgi:hypothetical protein
LAVCETAPLTEIVICEGVIPLQIDPKRFASNVSHSARHGGLFLLTTADEVSSLSEVLRRFIAHKLMTVNVSKLNEIVDFFKVISLCGLPEQGHKFNEIQRNLSQF